MIGTDCPVCGKASGRGRYGYKTLSCGSLECNAELRRQKLKRLQRNLSPIRGGGIRDWKPGLPGGGRPL